MLLQALAARRRRASRVSGVSMIALAALWLSNAGYAAGDSDKAVKIKTASPIKHVIIIVGENRSFDHVFATYRPKTRGETVSNLLSKKIVNADGSSGPNFHLAHQFKITMPPNNNKYFISVRKNQKMLYQVLPAPDLAGTPPVSPLAFILVIPGGDPGLPPEDQFLFGTGGSGLSVPPPFVGPDTRITNVTTLLPGPFEMTGPTMPYDAFTGDTIHEFFQMWQQMDCAIDKEHVSRDNPTGCLHDLHSAITTTFATPPGQAPHDTGQTMAFFNVLQIDAPFLKLLVDQYTMSDNYHQPVMGGTGAAHIPLGFADQVFFSDGNGNPATPATARIYNPDPDTTAYSSGNFNLYRHPAQWFNCSDPLTQPGVQAILNYLNVLPYPLSPKCDLDHFYPAVNISPAFNPGGTPTDPANNIPPVTMRSLGDALNEKKIPWKYYGGGYNLAVAGIPINGYCDICNPFEYQANYPSLRESNKEQWAETAIFVTFDEGGGYYDSGFIQPVDFFGTGPRIPMIAVSPFSKGGHIKHRASEMTLWTKASNRMTFEVLGWPSMAPSGLT